MFPRPRHAGSALVLIAILIQLGFLLAAAPEPAVAAPCAAGAPIDNRLPPPGIMPTLPQSGGGGAAEFCRSDPAACQSGGPAPGFSSASADGGAATASFGAVSGYAGSVVGRGHGTFLMLALAPRRATCGPAAPADPGSAPQPLAVPCPPPPPAPSFDGRGVALGLAVPWPVLRVGVNPAQWGLTGLPARFWVAGYDDRPLEVGTHVHKDGLPGPPGCPGGPGADLDVAVQAVVAGYSWDFGDGLPNSHLATADPGLAYPQVSTIHHEYTRVSAAGFPVTLTAHFALSYRTEGDWQSLGGADRTVSTVYRVQQAVPVVISQG